MGYQFGVVGPSEATVHTHLEHFFPSPVAQGCLSHGYYLVRVTKLAPLSHREHFFILHKDKAVLRPLNSFLSKVDSAFQLNQDIVLPSFLSGLKAS